MLNSLAQSVSDMASSGLSGLNTFATNVFQCLENGPQILQEPLDFEYLNKIPTTTEAAIVRTILGKYPQNYYENEPDTVNSNNINFLLMMDIFIVDILGACYLQNTQLAGYVGNGNDAIAFPSDSTAYAKCSQGKDSEDIFKYLDEINCYMQC